MPIHTIIGSDGQTYQINAPEGMTQEQVAGIIMDRLRPVEAEKGRRRSAAAIEVPTFGFGGEISSGMAALMAKASGDERPLRDIYSDIDETERYQQKRYAKENPGENMALEIGGGLATGGLGLARLLAKGSGKQAVPAILGGGSNIAKAASWVPKTIKGAAVVGAESALMGAGSADPGSRAEGAAWGATVGLAAGTLLKIPGALFRRIAKRKTVQDLGSGDKFIPLNVADPGWRGKALTRDIGGRAYGSDELIHDQTERVLALPRAQEARLAERMEALPNRFAKIKERVARQISDRKTQMAQSRKDMVNNARVQADQIKQSVPEIRPETIPGPDVAPLRQLMGRNALPPEQAALADKLLGKSILEARDGTADWWSKNGFAEIKKRQFQGPAALISRLSEMSRQSDDLMLEFGDAGKRVQAMADKIKAGKAVTIDGETLMALRNVFARGANRNVSDKFGKETLRSIANEFDNHITSQLDKNGKKYFAAQKDAYKHYVIFNKSVDKAFDKQAGEFSPTQVLSSEKRVFGPRADTPYGDRSRALQKAAEQAEAAQKAANEAAQQAQREAQRAARTQSASVLREARAARDAQALADAKELQRLQDRGTARINEKSVLSETKKALDDTKSQIAAIEKLAPDKDQQPLSKLFTTALIGSVPGAVIGTLTGVPGIGTATGALAGGKIASTLFSESGQRFIAGQTAWQKRLAEELRKNKPLMDQLYSGAVRGGVAQTGE